MPGRRKPSRQQNSTGQVDPEKIAGQGVVEFRTLNNGFGETVQSEIREEQTERCDHGHQTKICWRKYSGQDYGGNNLYPERGGPGKNSGSSTAHGQLAEIFASFGSGRQEGPILRKRPQLYFPCSPAAIICLPAGSVSPREAAISVFSCFLAESWGMAMIAIRKDIHTGLLILNAASVKL